MRPRSIDMKMEYGSLHHLFDETYANAIAGLGGIRKSSSKTALKVAADRLKQYVALRSTGLGQSLRSDLTTAMLQIIAIYPHYLHHYRVHDINWLAREAVFHVPFNVSYPFEPALPNRTVYLTGKRDGLYKAKDGNRIGIGVWEIKTKTKIDRAHLAEQLRCDSQSLFYLHATMLESRLGLTDLYPKKWKVVQETYDVLKRPALVRSHNESVEAYVKRCADRVAEKPNEFFAREVISVQDAELENYGANFLMPEVRAFLEWWESVKENPSPEGRSRSKLHYLNLGALINAWGKSPYYEALVGNQSSRTLRFIEVPFPELYDDEERAKIEAAEDLTAVSPLPQKDRKTLGKEIAAVAKKKIPAMRKKSDKKA